MNGLSATARSVYAGDKTCRAVVAKLYHGSAALLLRLRDTRRSREINGPDVRKNPVKYFSYTEETAVTLMEQMRRDPPLCMANVNAYTLSQRRCAGVGVVGGGREVVG